MSYDSQPAVRPQVEFGPPPAAFEMAPFQPGERKARVLASGGVCHWLSHAQHDLTGRDPVHTTRNVIEVTGNDGLQAAAQFGVSFDPRHERLVVHAVRVHRGGQIREAGTPAAFEIIQRELNMERAVYDGRMTAHMVIPDVREGDVVETAYSLIGANPALQGRLSWWFILQWTAPVAETRCTLRVAADRALTIRPMGWRTVTPEDQTANGVRVLDWRAIDLPPCATEAGAPPASVAYASVHAADAADWSDIAVVFRPFYEAAAQPPEELTAEIRRLAAVHPTAEARVAEGLRMVQGALRYHSVSIGEGGFRPRPLEEVWRTRYGDCKDGSVLLTAVLRTLGVDAVCALVNTFQGEDLPQTPPNVLAFNHCIVRARVGDRTIWLDPTNSIQAGDLDHLTQAAFHHALPLEPGAKLESMPEPPVQPTIETEEVWTFSRLRGDPAQLKLTTTYQAWRADSVRHWVANQGADQLGRQLREGLEQELGSTLNETAAPQVEDDRIGNRLTIRESYAVAKPYRERSGSGGEVFVSRDDVVGRHLPGIGPDQRKEPLQLGLPRRMRTTRIFHFPASITITPWSDQRLGPAGLVLDSSFEWRSRTEGMHQLTLTVGRSVLPAEDARAYREFLAAARDTNGITFPVVFGAGGRMAAAKSDSSWTWMIWPGIVLLLIAARMLAAA